jgi:hypothetical protein
MSPDVTQCHLGADRLNDRQLLAMSMMLAGKPDGEIVKAVGVHRRTLWRWRRYDDDFRSELLRRREALCEEAGDRLRALLAPALDVMEQHLFDRYDRNRFRAASAVLHVSNLRQSVPLRSQGLDTA